MFDGRLSEFLLIAILAIIVVGPKDLPRVMLKLGQWTRAAQRAAREFQTSLEQMAEEAEGKEVRRDLGALGRQAKAALTEPLAEPPKEPAAPAPTLSQLPPEGGSFHPPSEEDEKLALAPQPQSGSGG